MKTLITAILFVIFVSIVLFFLEKDFINVQIEFDKLRPVKEKINVYYNGFKIGTSKKIFPCNNSKNVCVNILLDKKTMFVPENITAKMKQKRIHERKYQDYIEIIYPKEPSYIEIRENAVIKGELAAGFHNYMSEEISYSEMERIKLSLLSTTENLEKATSILIYILNSLDEMAKTSNVESKEFAKNLNSSIKNIDSLTKKLNNSINEPILKNIIQNIDSTSGNFSEITYYLKNFTGNLNTSSSNITETINRSESISRNIDQILQGVNCTLRKPLSGLRLIFGKVIN